MMINCPKCGFSQPEDQYCAKCGVDMLAYRPREKSLFQQFMASTSSQLVVLMIFIAVGFVVFQVRNTAHRLSQLQASTNALADTFSAEESSEGAADFSQRHDMPAPEMRAAAVADTATTAASANIGEQGELPGTTLAKNPTSLAKPSPSASPGAHARTPITQLRVIFAEVPKTLLGDWFSDSKTSATQSGTMTAGVINNFEARIKAAPGTWRPLESPMEQAFHLNQIILVYKGTHDEASGQNIGLSLQVTATGDDESGTTVNVVSSRNLREGAVNAGSGTGTGTAGPAAGASAGTAQVVEVNFPEQQFVIPRGSAALMSGTLLHRPLLEEEVRFYSGINVLRVMADESYRAGNTEFVIFIQPR